MSFFYKVNHKRNSHTYLKCEILIYSHGRTRFLVKTLIRIEMRKYNNADERGLISRREEEGCRRL